MDLKTLIDGLIENGGLASVTGNPLAQFGAPSRQYLGATLLPERNVQENAFVEDGIVYRTVIANDGTRYSPVQIKGGVKTGSFQVVLGNSDIGSHFTSADYDALIRILNRAGSGNIPMQAMINVLRWVDRTLNLPLIEKNEKQRWEAIVGAQVLRTGDNNYRELVSMSNPTGHRVTPGGAWSDSTYDPYPDIVDGADFMAGKGYTINRLFASRQVISMLLSNPYMRQRMGTPIVVPGGVGSGSASVIGLPGRMNRSDLDNLFAQDGLPPIEEYNLQYATQTSTGYFLARDVLVAVATTGRDEAINEGADTEPVVVPDTIGYTGVGRPAGQSDPGRVTHLEAFTNKPPRIEGEAWQTSFPVVTEPEAIYVWQNIT